MRFSFEKTSVLLENALRALSDKTSDIIIHRIKIAVRPNFRADGLLFIKPFREQDSIFISWTSGWFSKDYNNGKSDCETIFELNYLWQLNQNISLQPVLQYVMKPNGNSDIKNALVLGGQVMVSF